MPLKFLFIFLVSLPVLNYAQKRDSIFFKTSKIDTAALNDYYNVLIFNGSTRPMCILYSASLIPINLEPANLVPYKENNQTVSFSLNFCAHDTLCDDCTTNENENSNLNAYIILPLQKINFDISLTKSKRSKDLKIEYILLDNLNYNEFHKSIFSNAATWYQTYKRLDKHLSLE